jgi:hypothetical protein
MSANAIVSAANNRRIRRARATPDAAFGLHRLTLSRLAFAIAAPVLAARGLTPSAESVRTPLPLGSRTGWDAEGRLSHYQSVAATPGFPRAIAGVITEFRLAEVDERQNDTVEVLSAPGEGRECLRSSGASSRSLAGGFLLTGMACCCVRRWDSVRES